MKQMTGKENQPKHDVGLSDNRALCALFVHGTHGSWLYEELPDCRKVKELEEAPLQTYLETFKPSNEPKNFARSGSHQPIL